MTQQIDVRAILTHILSGDGINKCRICMGDTTEGQVHLEDTVMMDGEKAVTLSEVLEILTGIEVEWNDDLPAGLCSACARSALGAANFRLFCQQASVHWRVTIELLNSLPSRNKNLALAIIDNKEVLLIDRKVTTFKPACHKLIRTASDNSKVAPRTWKCTECHKEFLHPFQLYYHLRESTRQACYICGKIMLRDDLLLHVGEAHNCILFDCKICPSLLLSQKQFEEHTAHAHLGSRNNSDSCKCVTLQSDSQKHTCCSIHPLPKCTNCKIVLNNPPCFLYHVQNCQRSDKILPDIHHAANNASTRAGTNNKANKKKPKSSTSCICDYCGKSFAGKKFVSAHIQIVHLKNTHRPCPYCGKLLAAAHMTEHVKRHLSALLFPCDDCGIVLKTKLGYVQHRRLHTGEKPYACKHCGESFSASSRRSEHVRQKHNPKGVVLKHGCELCPARFRLPYRLQKHMQNVHKNTTAPEKQFGCGDCRQKFETRRGLLHHTRRKHQLPSISNKHNS